MTADEIETVEKEFAEEHFAKLIDGDANNFTINFFNNWIMPSLRANAQRDSLQPNIYRQNLALSFWLASELFHALHPYTGSQFEDTKEKAKYLWIHQNFDIINTDNPKRGFSIGKEELLNVAAKYLSKPEIRTNRFDWLLLDCIVFAELDSFGAFVLESRITTSVASSVAEHNHSKYILYLLLLNLLSFALRFLAMPVLSFYLMANGHETGGLWVLSLWGVSMLITLINFPAQYKLRKKYDTLLQHLHMLYTQLGDSTISPRKLKESLDKAASDGVVLDGSVFSIVDRLIKKDATTFVPTQIG